MQQLECSYVIQLGYVIAVQQIIFKVEKQLFLMVKFIIFLVKLKLV